MAKRKESIVDLLMVLPWWVSVVLSMLSYIVLGLLLPSITFEVPLYAGIANGVTKLAPLIALVLLLPAPIAALNIRRKRKQLDQQASVDSIKSLSWKAFEELVAEAYRRSGFRVVENHQAGPDGGVDIRLEKAGQTHLVQCKNWKSQKIGVSVIREMFGLMTAEQAASVIIVCSGNYTQEARLFAKDKPIELIDGPALLELVKRVKNNPSYEQPNPADAERIEPLTPSKMECPKCGSELVLRTSKKGPNAGSEFYGCSAFPKCRFVKPL